MSASSVPTAHRRPGRSGLVTFGGIMLVIGGAFNLLDGFVAVLKDDYYVADELLFGDLTAWGIWWLLVGGVMLFIGIEVIRRKTWGLLFGITIAGANALTQLMFLGVYPAWSIAVMVVDGLIIYALTTHIEEFD